MATKKNCSSILFDLILYDALLLTDLSFQITQFNWNFNDERVRVCVLVYFELLLQFNWKWDNQSNVHMNGNVADAWQWHSEISCVDDNLVVYDCDHSRIGVYADMGIEMFDSLRSGLEHLTRFCTCCEAICAPIVRWSVYVRVHSINVQCCVYLQFIWSPFCSSPIYLKMEDKKIRRKRNISSIELIQLDRLLGTTSIETNI